MSKTQKELDELDTTVDALTDEYIAENQKLAELEQAVIDAKTKLEELEEDIELSFDEVAEKSTEYNRDKERAEFEAKAITKRLAKQREQLVRGINALEDKSKDCERESQKQRRAKAEEYMASEEWAEAKKMMWAMCALRDGFWDGTLRDMTPREPDRQERKAAAIDVGVWIDDPQYPTALERAKQVTDFSRDERR